MPSHAACSCCDALKYQPSFFFKNAYGELSRMHSTIEWHLACARRLNASQQRSASHRKRALTCPNKVCDLLACMLTLASPCLSLPASPRLAPQASLRTERFCTTPTQRVRRIDTHVLALACRQGVLGGNRGAPHVPATASDSHGHHKSEWQGCWQYPWPGLEFLSQLPAPACAVCS